jgi:predicted lipoprotein with Yx(FWY)xxD motif
MSKKTVLAVLIVIIILAVGGFAIFHKSNKPATNNTQKTQTSSTTKSNLPSVNNAGFITKTDSKVGKYLADPRGNTLYTYVADKSGVSNCTGSCLANWPAYQDKGATTGLPSGISTIKRTDNGQTQYTYNGMPLYYFTGDSQGKVTGDGIENFKVAKPAASTSSSQPTTSTPSPSSSNSNSSSGYPY